MEKANVETFWMYNSERFLRFASDHLEIKLTKGSVESVREVARVHSGVRPRNMGLLAEKSVKTWLMGRFNTVEETNSFPDFICTDLETGFRHGFEVKFREHAILLLMLISNLSNMLSLKTEARSLDAFTFVIVFPTRELAEKAAQELGKMKNREFGDNVQVLVGALEGSPAEFSPLQGF